MSNLGGGRADEFAQLLAAHEPQLFGYVYALVLNTADAEDIYQDTVLALWRKFGEYQSDTNFAAWARAAARFEVQHFFRGKSRRRLYFDESLMEELAETQSSLDQAQDSASESYTDALRHCKELLPEGDRRLIELCYSASATITQTAGRLGRSPQSVCNSLSRIRRVLFDCVRQATEARDR